MSQLEFNWMEEMRINENDDGFKFSDDGIIGLLWEAQRAKIKEFGPNLDGHFIVSANQWDQMWSELRKLGAEQGGLAIFDASTLRLFGWRVRICLDIDQPLALV